MSDSKPRAFERTKSFKVVTGTVRFSYVNVFAPIITEDSKLPKYSVALIIPKTDEETIHNIAQAVEQCKRENREVWEGKIPRFLKGGLRDGDKEKSDPAYKDSFFINATATTRPGVVDENCQDITSPSKFYSGCYGRAAITFYPYNNGVLQQGIGCTLNHVQKLEDGDKLGNASLPAEDFARSKHR